ncbi:hypothetical protein HY489_01145 [Candidatus Woesearchaeota archaeon]|nr:hypothetical protein [Candidatus Woesearchaeota archaeon]
MITKKTFETMRKYMEGFDKIREQIIAHSRKALKASKQAIYAAHRSDIKEAHKLLQEAKKEVTAMNDLIGKDTHLLSATGAYSDALEEYTEAACYVSYLENKNIPTPEELNVDAETYLCALSDVIGELVRKAVNSAANGDHKTPIEIKQFVTDLYAELMLFDWRNTPVRKKFDAIKYGLEKLEDLALKIALKK